MLLAQQLSARPSIVSIASEEGVYNVTTQALPADFGFIPTLKVIEIEVFLYYNSDNKVINNNSW